MKPFATSMLNVLEKATLPGSEIIKNDYQTILKRRQDGKESPVPTGSCQLMPAENYRCAAASRQRWGLSNDLPAKTIIAQDCAERPNVMWCLRTNARHPRLKMGYHSHNLQDLSKIRRGASFYLE